MSPQIWNQQKVVVFGATGTIGKAVVAALSPKYDVLQVGNRRGEFKADLADTDLNIGIASPSFSVWSGFFVNPDLPIALVVENETEAQRAQLELSRIGFDQVVGFITADDLDETQQITQIGACDFLASLESRHRPVILDVRSAQEWSQDHLEGATHIPLPQLLRHIGGFSRKVPLTVVCGSGYRSSIAASLLESEGFRRLSNVIGRYACRSPRVMPHEGKRRLIPVLSLLECHRREPTSASLYAQRLKGSSTDRRPGSRCLPFPQCR